MSLVFCEEVAREEIDIFTTLVTRLRLDPEKVFDVGIWGIAVQTSRLIERS
jgi:hypothetical protein